ncbi:MAG: hypothetical protein WCV84_05215 [Patescibacteria group bacterium]
MIVGKVRGDIFESPHQHLAFAVNAEGYNDEGFAGLVSGRFWPELAETGGNQLGETLSKQCGSRTFHALVCHELRGSHFQRTPQLVEECLNKLDVPENETIGVVLMGSGFAGMMLRADVGAILDGIERSRKRVVIYAL